MWGAGVRARVRTCVCGPFKCLRVPVCPWASLSVCLCLWVPVFTFFSASDRFSTWGSGVLLYLSGVLLCLCVSASVFVRISRSSMRGVWLTYANSFA